MSGTNYEVVRVRKIGAGAGSLCVTIPKEVAEAQGINAGDYVGLSVTPLTLVPRTAPAVEDAPAAEEAPATEDAPQPRRTRAAA